LNYYLSALSVVYGESKPILKKIDELKNYLLDKSVWIFGGDGWAYDIGFGGLDHVLAQGKNVNVLVLTQKFILIREVRHLRQRLGALLLSSQLLVNIYLRRILV
jgi:hypothetical protein